ncbi:MAG TPA: DUF1554 domain-containing protein [Turneriella sp.]|nr:DUF1554 domain-containing protein [Turneriella sp.]
MKSYNHPRVFVHTLAVFSLTTFVFTGCNNYGLVDMLENPAGFVSCKNEGPCYIFVATSGGGFNGNLGGIAGADQICNSSPLKPNSGKYKAVLVGSDANSRKVCVSPDCTGTDEAVDWVFHPNTTYVNILGQTIGTTSGNGIFLSILNPVSTSATPAEVWTGLNANWQDFNTCNNWTTSEVAYYGAGGFANSIGLLFSGASAQTCDVLRNLYCTQQ